MELATATSTLELAERYGEAWNCGELDAILALHTDDSVFQLHVLGAAPAEGRAAIAEAFAGFLAQLSGVHFATRRLHAGSQHWVLESTLTGTAAAPFELDGERIGAPGARVEVDCVDVFEVRDGRVARKDTYLDAHTFQAQLTAAE